MVEENFQILPDKRSERPPNNEREKNLILFYKVTSRETAIRRLSYEGPHNATLVFGIPKNPVKPIRIAYTRSGGTFTHAVLEPFASPSGTDYKAIMAYLKPYQKSDKTKGSLLEILFEEEKNVKLMEDKGFLYTDPRELLSEKTLNLLCKALKADRYEFVEDSSESNSIKKAIAELEEKKPKGSCLKHLKWVNEHREGD